MAQSKRIPMTEEERKARAKMKAREYYLAHRDEVIAKAKAQAGTPKRLAWLAANKEKVAATRRRRHAEIRERIRERKRRYYAKNREKINATANARYHTDPQRKESVRQQGAKRRAKLGKEAWSERIREYRSADRERFREQRAGYRDRHRETVNSYIHARRSRVRGSGGRYTAKEWRELVARLDHRCARCGEKKKLTVDHVVPVALGGTSNIDNIQPLCMDCNLSKGASVADYRGDQCRTL